MWELTKRISLRISSVLYKVEPDLYTGSDSATLPTVAAFDGLDSVCYVSSLPFLGVEARLVLSLWQSRALLVGSVSGLLKSRSRRLSVQL